MYFNKAKSFQKSKYFNRVVSLSIFLAMIGTQKNNKKFFNHFINNIKITRSRFFKG